MSPSRLACSSALEQMGSDTFPVSFEGGERRAMGLEEILAREVLLINEQIGRTLAPQPESSAFRSRSGFPDRWGTPEGPS
jgi:hypothetical protein